MRKVLFAVTAIPAAQAFLLTLTTHHQITTILLDLAGAFAGAMLIRQLYDRPAMRPTDRPVVATVGGMAFAVVLTAFLGGLVRWLPTTDWVAVVLTGMLCARIDGPGAPRAQTAVAVASGALSVVAVAIGFWGDSAVLPAVMMVALSSVVAAAIGLQARSTALRVEMARQTALSRMRQEMAGELHDVVAHEITGIVVLAQAAGAGSTGADARMFGAIEAAGSRALTEIRAMVAALREPGAPALSPAPQGPSEFHESVAAFAATMRARVEDRVDDEAVAGCPAPVLLTAHRVVVESLTNVRRHAADTRRVTVEVRRVRGGGGRAGELPGDMVQVRVADAGSRSSNGEVRAEDRAAGAGEGNGSGLLTLAERCRVLGGRFEAGADGNGGWVVVAQLPLGGVVPADGSAPTGGAGPSSGAVPDGEIPEWWRRLSGPGGSSGV
ncbi:Signal transduction histidine kinase [Austwickia chelonae]|uniref:histidine kinase n=1 Tax=Austwickia chelonae NBRC 105200 TaxID=1184607 RepID=K6UNS4_9MICO|nr:histidine kinase [Austwickia chelonae]GAB79211.1 putative two-component histidine kinase [Austwickia chelonae NBRC 105200]SEW37256.1 Signal transduction histidine kinase [Austwickia chelonae]